jgi:hypothetical protein
MKSKIALATVICAVIFVLVILANMIHGAKLMGRTDFAQAGISHLALFMEAYRDEHGSYPSSIAEMVRRAKPDDQRYLNEILQDQFHNRYEYQPLTNGFVIAVTTPSSWFIKYDRIEKKYGIGEALK